MAEERDGGGVSYYAILNVRPEATDSEIKRAYRTLAQTFHPDKHPTADLRKDAADGFALINEAYEVLTSPEKRRVYDVYGKQGLVAGLDLGSRLKTVEELREEWEKFKAEREEGGSRDTVHSSHMQCTIDATSLFDPYAPSALDTEIESIMMQSTLEKQINTHHLGWIGGNVLRSGEKGGGNLLAGCRGMIDSKTGYTAEAQWGSKPEIAFRTTHQLHENTQGIISTNYSPSSGAGLVMSSTQALTETMRGTAAFVVGPPREAGVQLALSQHTDDVAISTKVQVGALYSATGRVTAALTPDLSVRAVGRFGFNAIDAEVGVVKKFSEQTFVTLSVVYGIQGTYLKTRWNVGNYSLDVPIIFSRDPQEWKVALGAVTLTPLTITLFRYFVIRPLLRAYRSRQALLERRKHADQIRTQIQAALSSQNLQKIVAQRMMEQEALRAGLVVLKAEYGVFSDHALTNAGHRQSNGGNADAAMPPAVMDVTYAVQYLVADGHLELFAGVSKAGLMGFCDVSPGQAKVLKVQFLYRNRAYRAEVGDLDGLKLPRQGKLIQDVHEAEDLLQMARDCGYSSEPSTSG